MSDAYYSTNLETAPKVLILLLNRGKGIQFKIKLEFTMELDIGKYVNQKQANTNYKLIGVINWSYNSFRRQWRKWSFHCSLFKSY